MLIKDQMPAQGLTLFRWRSYLPLLFLPVLAVAVLGLWAGPGRWIDDWSDLWEAGCIAVAASGLIVRALAVGHAPEGTSGRNTKGQRAEVLKTTGMYSVVQHPLYLGNFLSFFGMAMYPGIWWLAVIATLSFWLYYERIMFAEEGFVTDKFGEAHRLWAERTPVFVPDFRRWRHAAMPFSLRTVLKREYSGAFLLIVYFGCYEVAEQYLAEREPLTLPLTALGVGLLLYLLLRTLKKRTRLLRVVGR